MLFATELTSWMSDLSSRDIEVPGVLRRLHLSSYAVLCRKKDGKLRMCIDHRLLNSRTIHDSYALPRSEEILEALGGNTYFSVLDMKSEYQQVEVELIRKGQLLR